MRPRGSRPAPPLAALPPLAAAALLLLPLLLLLCHSSGAGAQVTDLTIQGSGSTLQQRFLTSALDILTRRAKVRSPGKSRSPAPLPDVLARAARSFGRGGPGFASS